MKPNPKAIHVESVGDKTSAIYMLRKDGKWELHCIINPDDPWGHPWPKVATKLEMMRWKGSCTTHSVAIGEE